MSNVQTSEGQEEGVKVCVRVRREAERGGKKEISSPSGNV